jgi:hypothetical protein
MLFRTEDEEDQPAQQERSISSYSSGHRRTSISLRNLTGAGEEEEEEEDAPGLFKRVIIRVAKLRRHIQNTTTSSLDASGPLQQVSYDRDTIPFEWDEFICSWDQENPSIGCPPIAYHATPFEWDEFICSWDQENRSIDYPHIAYQTTPLDTFLSMDQGSTGFEVEPPPRNLTIRDYTASSSPSNMLNSFSLGDLDVIFGSETDTCKTIKFRPQLQCYLVRINLISTYLRPRRRITR